MEAIQVAKETYCCSVCETVSEHKTILSYYVKETGLDGRKVGAPIQLIECPVCHHTAWNIAEPVPPEVFDYVKGSAYQQWRKQYTGPEELRKVEQAIQIEGQRTASRDTAHYFLAAAWLCDDKGFVKEAREYRLKYLQDFQEIMRTQPFEIIRRLDCFRRTEQFEQAIAWGNESMPLLKTTDSRLVRITEYQMDLCQTKDSTRHFLSELCI